MLAQERQKLILDTLTDNRIIKTQDIAEQFGISNLTARRDLDALSEQGYVHRIYGGAVLIPNSLPNTLTEDKQRKNTPRKIVEGIGRLAAAMVEEGETIHLGNGTLTLEVAKNLVNIPNLTFITGSMMIANFLISANCRTYILGGLIDPYEQNIYSRSAMDMMDKFYPTKSFLGCDGITVEHGVTAINLPGAELGSISVHSSAKTIIVAHSWKFGKDAMNKVCDLSELYAIVTDDGLDPEYREKIEQTGVKLFYAVTDPKS